MLKYFKLLHFPNERVCPKRLITSSFCCHWTSFLNCLLHLNYDIIMIVWRWRDCNWGLGWGLCFVVCCRLYHSSVPSNNMATYYNWQPWPLKSSLIHILLQVVVYTLYKKESLWHGFLFLYTFQGQSEHFLSITSSQKN